MFIRCFFTHSVACNQVHKTFRFKTLQSKSVDLLTFYETATARMVGYFEQTLDLFAKLCVGGNMRTWDVVSKLVPTEILVAVLGLHTKYDAIPDRLKSLFWSIASVVYLHRPLHSSTLLGVEAPVRYCVLEGAGGGGGVAQNPLRFDAVVDDQAFLGAMKSAATDYLRRNTKQNLFQPERNILTKQVIQVPRRAKGPLGCLCGISSVGHFENFMFHKKKCDLWPKAGQIGRYRMPVRKKLLKNAFVIVPKPLDSASRTVNIFNASMFGRFQQNKIEGSISFFAPKCDFDQFPPEIGWKLATQCQRFRSTHVSWWVCLKGGIRPRNALISTEKSNAIEPQKWEPKCRLGLWTCHCDPKPVRDVGPCPGTSMRHKGRARGGR